MPHSHQTTTTPTRFHPSMDDHIVPNPFQEESDQEGQAGPSSTPTPFPHSPSTSSDDDTTHADKTDVSPELHNPNPNFNPEPATFSRSPNSRSPQPTQSPRTNPVREDCGCRIAKYVMARDDVSIVVSAHDLRVSSIRAYDATCLLDH